MSRADEVGTLLSREEGSRGFDRAVALIGAGAGVRAATAIITSGLSLVTTILLVRILGATLYGALALGLSIVALSTAVNKTGFGVAATRTIAAHLAMDDRDSAIDTTRGLTTLVLIGGTIGSIVVVAVVVATQVQLAVSVRLAVALGLGLLLIGRDAAAAAGSAARGFSRVLLMELPALAEVLSKFAIVAGLFLIGMTQLSFAAAGLGVSGVIAIVVAVVVVARVPGEASARGLRPSFGALLRLFHIAIPYAMVGVAVKLVASFDVFILGATHPGAPVGAYAPVLTLLEASVMLAPMLLATLFVAAATELFTRADEEAFSKLYVTVSKVSILLAMPAFCLLSVSPTTVIQAIFGRDFPIDVNVVRILLVGFFVNVVFGVNTQALIASGGRWRLARALILPSITMLCTSLALIPPLGATGAAMATTISYIVFNLMMSWTLYRTAGVHPVHRDLALVVTTSPLVIVVAIGLEALIGGGLIMAVASALIAWFAWVLLVRSIGAIRVAEVAAFLPGRRPRRADPGGEASGGE